MHDPPGLEVRDGPVDHVTNLVDLLVEILLPTQQLCEPSLEVITTG